MAFGAISGEGKDYSQRCSRPKCNEPIERGSDRCLFHPHNPKRKEAPTAK